MKRLLVAAVCAALAAALPRAGLAQDSLRSLLREARIACTEDWSRLCSHVPPGRGRVRACMSRHADKLSQPCFQAMTAWELAIANAARACVPDAERLCPNLRPRGPLGRACMRRNADRLSAACREALFGSEPFGGRNPE